MEGYLPTPVTNFELVDVHTADLEMIRLGEINPSSVYPDDLVSPLLDYTLKDQPDPQRSAGFRPRPNQS